MKIISVLNSKGGVGKSTLSCQLARSLQLLPSRVLLLDTDTDQLSAQSWGGIQADGIELPVVAAQGNLQNYVKSVRMSFDHIVIDGAAKLERQDVQAIAVSDFVLIPVAPSTFDVWPLQRLVEQVLQRRELSDGVRPLAAFVVAKHNPRVRETAELAGVFADYPDVPVLKAEVPLRIIYSRTLDSGRTVFDHVATTPAEEKAAEQGRSEILALRDEILSMIEVTT